MLVGPVIPPSSQRHSPSRLSTVDREKRLPLRAPSKDLDKEKHLYFDQVSIVVRSGNGGDGMLLTLPKRGEGPLLEKNADGDFVLPPGGGRGGDVFLVVDPSLSDLLHLRERSKADLAAESGKDSRGFQDWKKDKKTWKTVADEGSGLRTAGLNDARDLIIGVPPGTFVRTKAGKVLGDLVSPGQRLLVAKGGHGGPCVLKDERPIRGDKQSKRRQAPAETGEELQMTPSELKQMTQGGEHTQVSLELLLRTVADVGFVGFPNAGKSTLLAALSRASPEIAPFPFTTMMPNLGVMTAEGGGKHGALLADLPGLVEGAHHGRGLGRVFLRHLRRVKLVLYILDTSASANSTVTDQYRTLRHELKLYNPQYLERPHLVALNKLDLAWEAGGQEEFDKMRKVLVREIALCAAEGADETAPPVAIVPLSGLRERGLLMLRKAILTALEAC
ncbi:hypothetical protein AB1Y20_000622 [Prymnesium parvum]|uniref:Uncharacterized protein n=1 Tax=Prymnesium parvum TaxID=97485 RepID=A0AB34K5B3_PRYPA